MGMKVAAVSALCQDSRVFDAMMMAGTPCPHKGKIGDEALAAWKENPQDVPKKSTSLNENSDKKTTSPFALDTEKNDSRKKREPFKNKMGMGYSAREIWEEGEN